MASQKVKNVSYLAVATLDFSDGELNKSAVLIPPYAEVIHISTEVTNAGSGSLNLGFEGDSQAVAKSIDLSATSISISNSVFTSASAQELIATASATSDAVVKVRVQYFLPSEISIECHY